MANIKKLMNFGDREKDSYPKGFHRIMQSASAMTKKRRK